jgi:hypothetical protein
MVTTKPIITLTSTRVRDGSDLEGVGSRTLELIRPDAPDLDAAAALAPAELRSGG